MKYVMPHEPVSLEPALESSLAQVRPRTLKPRERRIDYKRVAEGLAQDIAIMASGPGNVAGLYFVNALLESVNPSIDAPEFVEEGRLIREACTGRGVKLDEAQHG